MHRIRLIGAALLLSSTAAALPAQLAPLGAPKGAFRFELQGTFQSADRRYLDGHVEDFLADYGSPTFGSNRIGALVVADSQIGRILGQTGYHLTLGSERANGQLSIGTATIGAALGVTKKLTLFANIPFVTNRVQTHLRNDSTTSQGGLNPAHPTLGNVADQGLADAFFSSFDNALSTLQGRIDGGSYAGNPKLDSLAREIAARGLVVRDALYGLSRDPNTASPFVPTTTSATGQQIVAVVRGLQDTLANALGVGGSGFSTDPVLPAARLSDDQFLGALTNPGGPYAVFPLIEARISRMGDMDIGAIYTLIDRFDRAGHRGGLRLAVTGLLRLPTGRRDNPANLIDAGTGNGRYEAGGYGTADIGAGNLGARLTGGYLVRLPARRVRRVGDIGAPYASAFTLTNVRENAGDILSLGARPFFRLVRNFAIHGLVDYTRIGADQVRYNSPLDQVPGIDAGALADKARTSLAIGGGVTYVGRAAHECEPGRRCGWPIDAYWNYSTIISATGGRVVKFRTTQLGIRWYQRIWR